MAVVCPACDTKNRRGAEFCKDCGAFILGAAQNAAPVPMAPQWHAGSVPRAVLLGACTLVLLVFGVGFAHWAWTPAASPELLQGAVRTAMEQGGLPGRDPICLANGLAYDAQSVNVQVDNQVTVSWMNTLVTAGLYAPAEEGSSGGFFSQPILVYRPLPELARWGGARRLCIARAVQLDSVANLGRVERLRIRGKSYLGLAADVHWALEQPAPWLAETTVAEAMVRELPGWRGAHWRPAAEGWRLTQRKQFVYVDRQWVLGDAIERLPSASAASAAGAAL